MCKGYYDKQGRPSVYAWVLFPAHIKHIKEGEEGPPLLKFIIDTGADKTTLSPSDVSKLGIEYKEEPSGRKIPFFGGAELEKGPESHGLGGEIQMFKVEGVKLAFPTVLPTPEELNNRLVIHEETLEEIHVPEERASIPNLLGRDVINRFDSKFETSLPKIDFRRNQKRLGSYTVRTGEIQH